MGYRYTSKYIGTQNNVYVYVWTLLLGDDETLDLDNRSFFYAKNAKRLYNK